MLALLAPTPVRAALAIMAEDDAAPWAQRDGSGAAIEIVKAAFDAAGVDIEIHTVAYSRCKHMVLSGQVAGCISMSADAALTDRVMFADQPLYRVRSQYFHNPQRPLLARNEAEIPRGAVVGIVTGYEYPVSVTELALRGIKLETAASESANLKKLAAGRIDAAVANLDSFKTADFLMRSAQVQNTVAPLFSSSDFGSYIGFSRGHPQGELARDKFNEGYARITRDGTLKLIMTRWQNLRR